MNKGAGSWLVNSHPKLEWKITSVWQLAGFQVPQGQKWRAKSTQLLWVYFQNGKWTLSQLWLSACENGKSCWILIFHLLCSSKNEGQSPNAGSHTILFVWWAGRVWTCFNVVHTLKLYWEIGRTSIFRTQRSNGKIRFMVIGSYFGVFIIHYAAVVDERRRCGMSVGALDMDVMACFMQMMQMIICPFCCVYMLIVTFDALIHRFTYLHIHIDLRGRISGAMMIVGDLAQSEFLALLCWKEYFGRYLSFFQHWWRFSNEVGGNNDLLIVGQGYGDGRMLVKDKWEE